MTRRKSGREAVLAVLADGDWYTSREIQEKTGLSQSVVSNAIGYLTMVPLGNPAVVMRRRPNPKWVSREERGPGPSPCNKTLANYRLRRDEDHDDR